MPVGNWARGAECRVIGELHGSQTVNVWHMGTDLIADDSGSLNEVLLQLAQAMMECIRETLLPAVTSDWKAVRVEAQEVFPLLSDTIVETALPTDVGQLATTNVSFAATLVNIRSGIGGRSHRGKKFLPPPGDANMTASDIDAGTLLLLAAFLACVAEKFMGADPTSDWHLGVFSPKLGGTKFQNFNAGFVVASSLNPVSLVAKMGSRKKGRGA